MATYNGKINLTESLQKLNDIVGWFEAQEDVDVETGLEKVKEAARLIKDSKSRLAEIENEFKEIEKEIGEESGVAETAAPAEQSGTDEDVDPDNIPF